MTIGKFLCALVLCILLYGFCNYLFRHFVLGYPDTPVPKTAAEWLVDTKRNPELCRKMPKNMWFGSQPAEQQAECIFWYASLTKDPTACELLMPSDYGLSCVGAAENHQLPCNTEVKPYSVYWRDGDQEHLENVQECSISDASRSDLGNQCCAVAQVAFIKDNNDCSAVENNEAVHDRCLFALAWKAKDETYCQEIQNENARAACSVQTKAYREDSTICPSCKPPLETVAELK